MCQTHPAARRLLTPQANQTTVGCVLLTTVDLARDLRNTVRKLIRIIRKRKGIVAVKPMRVSTKKESNRRLPSGFLEPLDTRDRPE